MITGERGIKKKITRKLKQHNHDRHYNIHKSQGKTSTTLQYPKITRKTSTTKARATHNKDRRYNIPLNLLLLAAGCKVPWIIQGALRAARCIVGAWVFRDEKVAHVLQRHACRWVETYRTYSTVYPFLYVCAVAVCSLSLVAVWLLYTVLQYNKK